MGFFGLFFINSPSSIYFSHILVKFETIYGSVGNLREAIALKKPKSPSLIPQQFGHQSVQCWNFYLVFSYIVLVLGVTTAVSFPLPVLALLESPAASDLQFFQQPLSRQHLSVAGKGCDTEVLLGSDHSGVSSYLDLDSLEECWEMHYTMAAQQCY